MLSAGSARRVCTGQWRLHALTILPALLTVFPGDRASSNPLAVDRLGCRVALAFAG